MKRIIFLAAILWLIAVPVSAQYARRIVPIAALPATCNPLNGEVYALTAAGPSAGVYSCTTLNTWKPIGVTGNAFSFAQGTITASTPFINHTATWSNGAVTFVNFLSTVTDTASAATSSLLQLRVGAATIFNVIKTGSVITAAAGSYGFDGRSIMTSTADGAVNFTNAAGTDFTAMNLGPMAVTHVRLLPSPAVAGQSQGLIIYKGDGTAAVFADLGAATNGSIIYCSDCTFANPCAGAGTGAIAKRLNGAWRCD